MENNDMLRNTTTKIYEFFYPEPKSLAEALAVRCDHNKTFVEDAIRDRRGARSMMEYKWHQALDARVPVNYSPYPVQNEEEVAKIMKEVEQHCPKWKS